MSEWKAENLRVTCFTPATWAESVEVLWNTLVGAPAENISQRPREAISRAEGSFEGARLVIAREPKRTDFVWVVAEDASAPFNEYPSIGDFGTVSKTFLTLMKTWLTRDILISRIAWGGVMVMPVATREDGYRRLSKFVRDLKIDPVASSDLLYQINRPRTSRVVEGLPVNRLCKWSVSLKQSMSVGLVVSRDSAEAVGGLTGPSFSACRLEFDINTDGTRKDTFAANRLVPLLDEMVELSIELAAQGDVP